MSLTIPYPRRDLSRSSSTSSLRRPVETENDLAPVTRTSRPGSESSMRAHSDSKITNSPATTPATAAHVETFNDLAPLTRTSRPGSESYSIFTTPIAAPVTTAPTATHIAPALPTDEGLPVPKPTHHIHFAAPVTPVDELSVQPSSPAGHKREHVPTSSHASNEHFDDISRGPRPFKTLFIGSSRKRMELQTTILIAASPYFATLFERDPAMDNLIYPEVDDFAFKIWMRWLYTGDLGSLTGAGAEDFHALTHYLGVYCLALQWEMEGLQNSVMDLISTYYAEHTLTSPPYRLEYIYKHTSSPNPMRDFLLSSAA